MRPFSVFSLRAKLQHAGAERRQWKLMEFRLGLVDVHRKGMTVAAMAMNAVKLVSVFQQRMAIPLYSLSFPKKFSIIWRHL